jgi:peptide/nickel transport system substrate-binding protein
MISTQPQGFRAIQRSLSIGLLATVMAMGCAGVATHESSRIDQSASTVAPTIADDGSRDHQPQMLGRFVVGTDPFEVGIYGGTIRVEIPEAPTTFNPAQNLGLDGDRIVMAVLFAPLVERIDVHTPHGTRDLAESHVYSSDGKTVDVTLRANANWSDGRPITPDDVVYSLRELYFNEDVGGIAVDLSERLGGVTVEAVGERTVRIRCSTPDRDLHDVLDLEPMPRHVVEPWLDSHSPEDFWSFWSATDDLSGVVSSGPFVLESFTPELPVAGRTDTYAVSVAKFVRNDHYFLVDAAGQRLPYLDSVTLVSAMEGAEPIDTLYWDGHIDLAVLPSVGPAGPLSSADVNKRSMDLAEQIALMIPGSHYLVEDHATWATDFLTFNLQRSPGPEGGGLEPPVSDWFNDVRFRRAVSHLVPRDHISTVLRNGGAVPAVGWITPVSPYHSPQADELVPRFDPRSAEALLDDMDLKDRDGDGIREDASGAPVSFSLITNENESRISVLDLLSEQFRNVGLDLVPEVLGWNEWYRRIYANEYDLVLLGVSGHPTTGPGEWSYQGDMHLWDLYQPEPLRSWEASLDELGGELEVVVTQEHIRSIIVEGQVLYNTHLPIVQVVRRLQYGIMREPYRNISQPSQGRDWDHVRSFAWVFVSEK